MALFFLILENYISLKKANLAMHHEIGNFLLPPINTGSIYLELYLMSTTLLSFINVSTGT